MPSAHWLRNALPYPYPYPLSLSGLALLTSGNVLFSILACIFLIDRYWLLVVWLQTTESLSYLLIKLMKGRRRNADEEQAACQTPFQFIEFSCDPLAHSSSSFLCQTKSSRPIRDESHSFVFPPNFIYLSPSIP